MLDGNFGNNFGNNNPFCDDYRPLIPSDRYISSNYALVGCANPKTYVPPIIAIKSHDLSEWGATNLVTMSGINDQTNFDFYRSGYSPNPIPVENVTVRGLNARSNYDKRRCDNQLDRVTTQYVGPDKYQQTRLDEPIQSNIGISLTKQFDPMLVSRDAYGTVTYKAVDGNYPLNTYCGSENRGDGDRHHRGGLLYNDDGRERTHLALASDGNVLSTVNGNNLLNLLINRSGSGGGGVVENDNVLRSGSTNDQYNRSVVNVDDVLRNLRGDGRNANNIYSYNGSNSEDNKIPSCECDDRDAKEDVSHWPTLPFDDGRANGEIGTSVNPNWIYAKDKLIDYDDVYQIDSKDRYTTLNKLIDKNKKYRPTNTNPSIYNTFDPRFSGYGDASRYAVNEMTGAPTFDYRDIDSITREKLISRSDVDIYPWAMSSNANLSSSSCNCDDDANYGQKGVDAYTNSTLKFRTELQERLMRKRNAEMWQRRVAPIYRNY